MELIFILKVILILALIGIALWAVVTYVPMPPPFKTVTIAVTVILVVFWIITAVLGPTLTLRG